MNISKKENTTIIMEYTIKVKNEGNVDGYAKEIRSYIPEGMRFISELNEDWYVNSRGEASNRTLANELIKTGEEKELKLILVKELNEASKELIHTTAEIKETYNQYGIKATNAQMGQVIGSDGIADILIVERDVVKETVIEVSLSVGIIGLISLIGLGIYKKLRKTI